MHVTESTVYSSVMNLHHEDMLDHSKCLNKIKLTKRAFGGLGKPF